MPDKNTGTKQGSKTSGTSQKSTRFNQDGRSLPDSRVTSSGTASPPKKGNKSNEG